MKYLEKHNRHLIRNQEAIKKSAIGKPEKPTDNTFPPSWRCGMPYRISDSTKVLKEKQGSSFSTVLKAMNHEPAFSDV